MMAEPAPSPVTAPPAEEEQKPVEHWSVKDAVTKVAKFLRDNKTVIICTATAVAAVVAFRVLAKRRN